MSEKQDEKKKIVMCAVCWRAWDWEAVDVPDGDYWISLDDLLKSKMVTADNFHLTEGYCPDCLVTLLRGSQVSCVRPSPVLTATPPRMPL